MDRKFSMKKNRVTDIIFIFFLFAVGFLGLLFTGKDTGVVLQDDSVHYLENTLAQGVRPIYPAFILGIKILAGENYQYIVVVIQCILAVISVIELTDYLKQHFSLSYFDSAIIYAALMLLYGIDYVYGWIPHQILTEGLAYPLFYIWFKQILKIIWDQSIIGTTYAWLLAVILGLVRSQLLLLLPLTGILFVYAFIFKWSYKSKKGICCGIAISIAACVIGSNAITIVDSSYRDAMRSYVEKNRTEDTNIKQTKTQNISKVTDRSAQTQSALALRVLYLADEEDASIFENQDVKMIFEIGYQRFVEEKLNYKFADSGLNTWRSMTRSNSISGVFSQAIAEYSEENPGWNETLSVSVNEARTIIVNELLKEHWVRYLWHSVIYASHGGMCTAIWENEQHLVLCYTVAVVVYLAAAFLIWLGFKKKYINREKLELLIVTIFIACVFVGAVSLVLFTIRRYVCYTVGMLYCAGYLLLKEAITGLKKK